MYDLDRRLTAIFRAAFPGLDEESARLASRETISAWDSIASMMLFSLVEEEFGQLFDLEDAAKWDSYRQIHAALEKRIGA